MTPVWIALGALALALFAVFIATGTAKTARRKEKSGDGGGHVGGDAGSHSGSSDCGSDGGGCD